MGCLYLEIEGQSYLVGSVDQALMKNKQLGLLDRTTIKMSEKKRCKLYFPHSDVTRNISSNNPQNSFSHF